METEMQLVTRPVQNTGKTLRDVVAVPFLHKKAMIITFLASLFGLVLAIFLLPDSYTSEMAIMVKNDRPEAQVTAGPNQSAAVIRPSSQQDVNSEVDLLNSEELLRKVVLDLRLYQTKPVWWKVWKRLIPRTPEERVEMAVNDLQQFVQVNPPNNSNLIRATYSSSDPQRSANVLNSLAKFYLQKHLEVNSVPGTLEFFQKEAQEYRNQVDQAKAKLADFNQNGGVVSAQLEKESVLQKLLTFQANQQETKVAIAASEERISTLKDQLRVTAPRVTTQIRTPSSLLEQLNATLFTLQLKRSELLQKFAPTHRPVRDIEEQIAHTRAAIKEAETKPLVEPWTAENPIYGWANAELAKERSQLAAFRATAAANARGITDYQQKAHSLDKLSLQQQDFLQTLKTAEENYLFALKKQEEARVSAELDRQRIANVAIAEAAVAPVLPDASKLLRILIALVVATMVSIGGAFVADAIDPSFRTPAEAEALLQVPILAVLPRSSTTNEVNIAG